jgi:hypothetical protein
MFCVKCGVELSESENKCPLCNTPVYYPEKERGELKFPEFKNEREPLNARGLSFVISFFAAIAAVICVVCNITVSDELSWSVYAVSALALAYVVFVLPSWFRRPSVAVFVPVDFFAAAVFVAIIAFMMRADWYFTFALPVIAFLALVVSAIAILSYYLRRGYLYIWGGAFILFGIFMPILEYLLHLNFSISGGYHWCFYPFAALVLLGIMLIVIAIVKPFRESLRKIFHL